MNNSSILAAAEAGYNVSLDLAHICTDNGGGRAARFYDGVYHFDCRADEEGSEKDEQWLDLGDDMDEDWEAALQTALEDALENGISQEYRMRRI